MAVSSKQFVYLNEMGIQLWQRKSIPTIDESHSSHASTSTETQELQNSPELKDETKSDVINVSLSALAQTQCFQDILTFLGCSSADFSEHHDHFDCGLFNWQFSSSNDINFQNNRLRTPNIEKISANIEIKKSLFSTILKHDLFLKNQ